MGEWEPLAERAPVDVRRLATQLRRMKDRSGLSLSALAARTSQSAEAWESYLAAGAVPPLFAVERLAWASGADHERATALWKLARKSAGSSGRKGWGRPLPVPDPLDPLTAEEGLPPRRGRFAALSAMAVLALGAFLTVLLTAVPGTGRTPPPGAAPSASPTLPSTTPASSRPPAVPPAGSPDPAAPSTVPPSSASPTPPSPSTASETPSTPLAPTATPTQTLSPTPSTSPPSTPSRSPTPPPASPSPPECRGILLLGLCIGG